MLGSSNCGNCLNTNKWEFMANRKNVGNGPSNITAPICDLHWEHWHRRFLLTCSSIIGSLKIFTNSNYVLSSKIVTLFSTQS